MHYYKAFGYIIRSIEKIQQLYEIEPQDTYDIEIFFGAVPEAIAKEQSELASDCHLFCNREYFWLENSRGIVVVLKTGKIYVKNAEGVAPVKTLQFALSHGIVAYSYMHNRVVLHCGCVKLGTHCIAVTGESKSGKSTITNELMTENAVLLSDDIIAISYDESQNVVAYPSYPMQKICEDIALRSGCDLNNPLSKNSTRRRYGVYCHDYFDTEPQTIDILYYLMPYDPESPENTRYNRQLLIKEVTGYDALSIFINNLFLRSLYKELGMSAYLFQLCLDFIKNCKVYAIMRPLGVNTEQEIKKHIMENST